MRHVHFAYKLSKATRNTDACTRPCARAPTHTHTHTHRNIVLLLLHGNSGIMNAPQCYVIRKLPLFPIFPCLNLNSRRFAAMWVNYLSHWLLHSVILVAFLSSAHSIFKYPNFRHIPFSKPTSPEASALARSQRKQHSISQTLRLRRRRRPKF